MTDLQRFDLPGPPRLPNGFDVPFEDAISWAVQRGAKLAPAFYGARLQAARARSFTVTGLATLDQVQQVADAATVATSNGQTFRDWQRAVLASDQGGELFSLARARRELIFRNAVQTNYGIGRTIQQRENATARPYLMWDAINDSRTRDSHRAMDGHIAPIGAPVWRTWNAPAGHNCRCTRIALTEAQARARGYPKLAPLAEPDTGWEGDPTEGNDDLVRVVQARRDACGVGFAAKGRGRGLWCDPGPARQLLGRAALELQQPSESPAMASKIEIVDFVRTAAGVADALTTLVVGPVENAAAIRDATGFDLTGYSRLLDNYGVRHTLKQHGSAAAEAKRGQLAVTIEDFALIPLITSQPDAVRYDGKNKIGRDVLVFTKLIGGIGYRHVDEIRSRRRLVATDSLRKKKGPWGP